MKAVNAALFPVRMLVKLFVVSVQLFLMAWAMYVAYDIRMYPIQDFGMVIHEFDPWFNYRAAEYMAEHGIEKFWKWYDYKSWYPIGRPIGTTIYPGMQMTAYGIREAMIRIPPTKQPLPKNNLMKYLRSTISSLKSMGYSSLPTIPKAIDYAPMSVNDICCMIPPWFGAVASMFTGLLAHEITQSMNSAVIATGIMAIIPAHLMRSVGGEFDNECVAMAAIASTFWLWLRSIRTPSSWPWGVLTGFSYIYMVLSWGGYIFVLNMIGVHALMLVGLGRFNSGVHKAYTLFFIIGTYGAIQIPVVGWQPLRSLEQMGPLLVFLGYQVLAFCDFMRRRRKMEKMEFVKFRIFTFAVFLAILLGVAILLYPTGYFGPLSARIRGLFVKHTKTGNPLVDSVAEHQPASAGIYKNYLNLPLDYGMHGAAVCLWTRSSGCWFAALYGAVAIHFSGKMSRLVLICAPICTVGCAIFLGFLVDLALEPIFLLLGKKGYQPNEMELAALEAAEEEPEPPKVEPKSKGKDSGKAKKGAAEKTSGTKDKKKKANSDAEEWKKEPLAPYEEEYRPGGAMELLRSMRCFAWGSLPTPVQANIVKFRTKWDSSLMFLGLRLGLALLILMWFMNQQQVVTTFVSHCHQVARSLANPKVVTWAREGGKIVKMDDYLKGYQWVDKNTPEDARVIAWWDYGYQITGIARRTSIADGNTWNHEHIATLGRTLTSSEKKAHNTIRHWADYLLVWAGGGGDDLGKSPHLARIGNSVFPDHCGDDDPRCTKFGFYQDRTPTPMMAKSLLYKAVMHNLAPGVKLNSSLFQEVHTTKRGKMRVYKVMNVSQESKDWIADPKNRVCDAPGSWYCVGQYPPALEKLIAKRKNFAQVEDFNRQGQKSAYTRMIEEERKKREL